LTAILPASYRKYANWLLYGLGIVFLIAWLGPLVADKSGVQIAQRTISGLLLGGIYATIALGIVVINKASGVFNFAHGGMMMVSGFLFFSFFTEANIAPLGAFLLATATVVMVLGTASARNLLKPLYLLGGAVAVILLTIGMSIGGLELRWLHAMVGAICGTVLLGLVIERFTIRPLIGQPIFAAVMVTLALAEILVGLTNLLWGAQPRSLLIFSEPHPFLPGQLVRIQDPIRIQADFLGGSVLIDQPRLLAFVIALIAFGAFFALFRYTSIGLAMRATSENQQLAESVGLRVMRATSENQQLAESVGLRVRVILAVTWGIAALLAGIAGVLYAGSTNSSTIDTNLHFIALRAFPAVLLGGLESITGALVGGLVLGLTEEWAKLLFTGDVAENLAPYVVLMIILVVRPQGLFGEKRIERI